MRAVVVVSKTCFSASIASRRGGRGWLETRAPRMIAEELGLLRIDSIEGVRKFAGKRGGVWDQKEGAETHYRGDVVGFQWRNSRSSSEKFARPGGAIWRERRGRMEREMWGSYRHGRGAVSAAG
jgi:hypothetical protein